MRQITIRVIPTHRRRPDERDVRNDFDYPEYGYDDDFRTQTKTDANRERGFTLVELLVATVVSMLVLGGAVALTSQVQTGYRRQVEAAAAEQEGRYALEWIGKLLRGAGNNPFSVARPIVRVRRARCLSTSSRSASIPTSTAKTTTSASDRCESSGRDHRRRRARQLRSGQRRRHDFLRRGTIARSCFTTIISPPRRRSAPTR